MRKLVCLFFLVLFISSVSFSEEIQNVSNSPGLNSFFADIAIDNNGYLHVVWVEQDGISSDLYYSKSMDDGNSWSSPKIVTTQGMKYAPAIDVDSEGNPHIVYYSLPNTAAIYHTASYDGGNTWTARFDISYLCRFGWNGWPRVRIDNLDRIHVVWNNGINGFTSVYYSVSEDGGSSWTPPLRLSGDVGISLGIEIAIDKNNNPHVAFTWSDTFVNFTVVKVLYRYYNGSSWSDTFTVHSDDEHKTGPSVTVDSENTAHIIWSQAWTDNGIFYRSYDGTSWSRRMLISGEPTLRDSQKLAVDSNDNLVAVWLENHSMWDGQKFEEPYKVLYNFYSGEWGEPKEIEEGTLAPEATVRLAIDSKNCVHIVWTKGDKFDFSREVYHMKFNPYPYIEASVNIDPDTLNLKSEGKWITAYISLPEGYNAADIDVTSLLLNEEVSVAWGKVQGYEFMAKFPREEVAAILELGDEVEIKITGNMIDGIVFQGSDKIRVIKKGKK